VKISGTATGEVEEIEEIGEKDLIFIDLFDENFGSSDYYPSGWRAGT